MNKFEFLLNLDKYRNAKPKNVLYHDSYDIPKKGNAQDSTWIFEGS